MKIPSAARQKKYLGILRLLVYGLIISSCANIVAPTGGPVDNDPPQVVRAIPENYSVYYEGQRIRIWFDEYVKLDNINQKLLVSPPQETNPDVRIKGKSIIISPNDTFRANTTYSIFFADAIRDITENNPIQSFSFVVSTGSYVDSLSVKGKVIDAWELKAMESIFVMLYDNLEDSIPMKEKPVYISQTNKQGEFRINNIRPGTYRMFALKDLNYNFIFDLPNEQIAFLDSLIVPVYEKVVRGVKAGRDGVMPDSLAVDSIEGEAVRISGAIELTESNIPEVIPDSLNAIPALEADSLLSVIRSDSLLSDSLKPAAEPPIPFYTLFLFEEKDSRQALLQSTYIRKGLLSLVFRQPVDSLGFNYLGHTWNDSLKKIEYNPGRDTLLVWLPKLEADSIHAELLDKFQVFDTLETALRVRPQATAARGRGGSSSSAAAVVDTLVTLKPLFPLTGTAPWFADLMFQTNNPLTEFDIKGLMLMEDSVVVQTGFEIKDSIQRKFLIRHKLKKESHYILEFLPGTFTDIFGQTNDTIRYRFKTDTEANYGTLDLELKLPIEAHFLFQLTDDKGNMLQERVISQSTLLKFANLKEGRYLMRLIKDDNQNGKWDAGNYLKGIQPERVYLSKDPVQIRANWENESTWNIQDLIP